MSVKTGYRMLSHKVGLLLCIFISLVAKKDKILPGYNAIQ